MFEVCRPEHRFARVAQQLADNKLDVLGHKRERLGAVPCIHLREEYHRLMKDLVWVD